MSLKYFALFAFLCVAHAAIEATITLSSDTYRRGDPLVVDWTLKSNSGLGQSIRTHYTPLEEGFNSDLFSILTPNGVYAEYQGRLVRRTAPQIRDFEFISTMKGKSGQHVISEGYKFYTLGEHSVVMNFIVNTLSGESYSVMSNVLTFVVEEEDLSVPQIDLEEGSRTVSYLYCSNSQKNDVSTAISIATSSSDNVCDYMSDSCTSSYVTWFGTYSSSRWNTVKNCYNNIHSALASNNFKINCDCDERGVFAFVYPTDTSKTINLCSAFWSAPNADCRTDSKPGTLTHEMSHFNAVCGNDDIQYGTSGCKQLAKTSPSSAVKNADSYEYMQESCPKCGLF